jgi:long-subunit acyl-CoA synthetase (AMP-forming)
MHQLFDEAAQRVPSNNCLGVRKWLPESKTWDNKYTWTSYSQVAERRKNLGAGLVEIHRRINYTQDKFGVGLWCQNRPEWQITGTSEVPVQEEQGKRERKGSSSNSSRKESAWSLRFTD